MEINELERAVKDSWDKQSCFPGCASDWTPKNPALGQCAVTSLIVQDYLGGDLLFNEKYFYFWNRLPDKSEVDLTRSQFPQGTPIEADKVELRTYVLESQDAIDATTPQRYELLKSRVEEKLR